MTNQIPYAFYKQFTNGTPFVQILPQGTPAQGSGLTPIDFNEAKQILQSQVGQVGNTNYGPVSMWDKYLNDPTYGPVIQAAQQGQTKNSGFFQGPSTQNNPSGFYSSNPDIPDPNASDPNMVNIGTADAPAYVPKGSPADLLRNNPTAYNQQFGTPSSSSSSLNPVFYKPDPNSQQVYNAQGQPVDYNTYLAQGGKPDFSNVTNGTVPTATNGTTGTGTTGSNFTPTGDPNYDALLQQMQTYLDTLTKNGQVINPNVTITPDQLAAFTAQAVREIHPYYATQLQAATDSFLSGLGYNVKQLNAQVQQAQTQYGRNLDTLSSNSADQGFAQSGIRQKQEGQLANDTQFSLDQSRSSLMNTADQQARAFAQQYGGANVPTAPNLGQAPRVLPGQGQFDYGMSKTGLPSTSNGVDLNTLNTWNDHPGGYNAWVQNQGQMPGSRALIGQGQSGFNGGFNTGLYTLNPDIYNKLIGTEQNSEKQATDTLSSQLASNAQQLASNQQSRTLNLT